jgi:Domain of unknown function (DUF4390)
MRRLVAGPQVCVLCLVLATAVPVMAELRIGDLDIFLNDHDVTVRVVLLGAIPAAFSEGIHSGIAAHARFRVELWRYSRMWPDRLVMTRKVERNLTYNVVTKEYRVMSMKGETRPPYVTRELRDAQRVLSELGHLKLMPASSLDPEAVFYVRVHADAALNGENTFLTRMSGTAEQTIRQSDYYTLARIQ